MSDFFKNIWNKLKKTVQREIEDLSYMEIVTATSEKVDGHIDNKGWDILDSLRRGKPPSEYGDMFDGEQDIEEKDMMTLENTEILARTRIELDADVFNVIKSKKGESEEIRKDAMELHQLGMKISVENWQYFLQFILGMTATIGVIVGNIPESRLPHIDKLKKI